MKKTLITSILIISFTPALGNAETGDDLLKYTKSANKVMSGDNASTKIDYLKAGQLLGFVTGVVDSLNAVDFCISPEVKKRVLVDTVSKYLEENKGKNSIPGIMSVSFALGKEYPCTENRKQCIHFGGKYCESW